VVPRLGVLFLSFLFWQLFLFLFYSVALFFFTPGAFRRWCYFFFPVSALLMDFTSFLPASLLYPLPKSPTCLLLQESPLSAGRGHHSVTAPLSLPFIPFPPLSSPLLHFPGVYCFSFVRYLSRSFLVLSPCSSDRPLFVKESRLHLPKDAPFICLHVY